MTPVAKKKGAALYFSFSWPASDPSAAKRHEAFFWKKTFEPFLEEKESLLRSKYEK
jgi:hypothetical protein